MDVIGLKCSASGSTVAIVLRECVRWVSKALFEGLGRGGCISRLCGVSISGGEEAGGIPALGNEEVGAAAGNCASSAGFRDGGEEGTSRRGRFVLGGEDKGVVAGGRAWIGWSSNGDEEGPCNRGRFAVGGEAGRVVDGELEANGRLREGELDISSDLEDWGVGCESGITLGGVCQLSD